MQSLIVLLNILLCGWSIYSDKTSGSNNLTMFLIKSVVLFENKIFCILNYHYFIKLLTYLIIYS